MRARRRRALAVMLWSRAVALVVAAAARSLRQHGIANGPHVESGSRRVRGARVRDCVAVFLMRLIKHCLILLLMRRARCTHASMKPTERPPPPSLWRASVLGLVRYSTRS